MVLSRIIALAGKGGVGKSTIAAQMIRELSKNSIVLAIDADPNSNLPDKLGLEYDGTIGGMRNELVDDPDKVPAGISKHEYMATEVRKLLVETERIDMLVMGRPEGAGCYCFTNNVLKECLSDLIPKYDFTIIDNEAGMEHLSRKVIPYADVLILVSDPTVIGIKTASRLMELAKEVDITVKRTVLAINNVRSGHDELIAMSNGMGFDAVHLLPSDDMISNAAMETAVVDLPSGSKFRDSVIELIGDL